MTAEPMAVAEAEERRPWTPMIGLFLAQILMSFNVAALPISLSGMVDSFDVSATIVSSTIVVYGLAVAALVMVGAKLGQRVGWVFIFRIVVCLFAISALLMIVSPAVGWAIAGQILAGVSAAVIVPSLVALIAENYQGPQQATAVGSLGSARALSGVSAFMIGGALGTWVGWRPIFGIVLALAIVVLIFSFWLRSTSKGDAGIRIDVVGAVLVGLGIVALTMGFNNLNSWGIFFAESAAPFGIAGISPAPILALVGVVLVQLFVFWTLRRIRAGRVPLVDLSVLETPRERAALYAMFIVVSLEAALNFSIPLYIQIVQGRSPFATSLAMLPFNLTVFVTAMLVVRFYKRYSRRVIGRFSFLLTTAALVWLAFVVTNNWETVPTIVGLIVFGIGQGSLVTLVFNVLVTSAPKHLAGDVGSLRGSTQNLASAVGTAVVGALLVTILSLLVGREIVDHPEIPRELVSQVDLSNVDFVSNDQLRETLESTDATPAQVDAAVSMNEELRLKALKFGLLLLAGVSAIAVVPASRLPGYRRHELDEPFAETEDD